MTFGPSKDDKKLNEFILGKIDPQTAYDYEDIWLTPKYSSVSSRKECDTSVELGGHKFNLPIIPANMATVIGQEFAIWLAERGYFYIMHRFDLDQIQFCKDMSFRGLVKSISLGVKEADRQLVKDLEIHGIFPEFITIDIAHGNSVVMKEMLQWLKTTKIGKKAFVIAGNVCEPEGVANLEEWGADAVKAGIGGGSVCTTRLQTGFTCPQFTAVQRCASVANVPIIADGGIKYVGDIAKSLVAGATMAMAGGMFAGHEECPGEVETIDGHLVKEYYGSASEFNKGHEEYVEGKKIIIDYKGPVERTMRQIEHGLQSAISYAGGSDLSAFLTTEYVIDR